MLTIEEPSLGLLDLADCVNGIVDVETQIGSPTVRAVESDRALANGQTDQTQFSGGRAITTTIRLRETAASDRQSMIDRVVPYMQPHLRPRLSWTQPGSTSVRSAIVRGVDYPVAFSAAKHPFLALTFHVANSALDGLPGELSILPSADTEAGRTYDLDHDRAYPATLGIGARLLVNEGNAIADWECTIYGECDDPELFVNGVRIQFDGLSLTTADSLTINTKSRTMLLNNDPTQSRRNLSNFAAWRWQDVRFKAGENLVRYTADSLGSTSSALFRWRAAWLA